MPAALALGGAGVAALLADRLAFAAALVAGLLALLARAPAGRRRPYVVAALASSAGVFVVWPLFATLGWHVLWSGPTVPVLGVLDVTREELVEAGLYALRLAGLSLAFACYALVVDHDALVASAGVARRSALSVALATRLVPTLERDAAGLAEAVRGRGLRVDGLRARARLLSPLVGGSLERAASLAEAMEARGYGRPGRTRAPRQRWRRPDWVALAAAGCLVLVAALWL